MNTIFHFLCFCLFCFFLVNCQESYNILIVAPSFMKTDDFKTIIERNFFINRFNRDYAAVLSNKFTFTDLKIDLLTATPEEIITESNRLTNLKTVAVIKLGGDSLVGNLNFLNLEFPNVTRSLNAVPVFTNLLPLLISNDVIVEKMLTAFLEKEPISNYAEYANFVFVPDGYDSRIAQIMENLRRANTDASVISATKIGFTNVVYYKDYKNFMNNLNPPKSSRFICLLGREELDNVLTLAIEKNFLQPKFSWIVLNLRGTRNILDRNKIVLSSQNKVLIEFSHDLSGSIDEASSLKTILSESAIVLLEYLRYILTEDPFVSSINLDKTGNVHARIENNEYKVVKTNGFKASVYHGIGQFKRLKSSFIIEENGQIRPSSWQIDSIYPPKVLSVQEFKADIRKTKLKILAVLDDPMVIMKKGVFSNPNDAFSGFYVDLFKEIMNRFDFSYELTEWSGAYGIRARNGSWTGALSELLKGKYDIALGDYAILNSRMDTFDFISTRSSYMTFIHKKLPNRDEIIPTLFLFIMPFHWKVWATIGGSICLVALSLYFVNLLAKTYDKTFSLFESTYFTIGCILQGVSNIPPKTFAGKIIACVWWFFSIIIVVVYIANFCVLWLDQQMSLQKNITHKVILSESNSSIGYYPDTSTEIIYANSEITELRRAYYIGAYVNKENILSSDQAILDRMNKDPNFYFLNSLEAGEKFATKYCFRTSAKVDFYQAGFVVRKGSSLKQILDAEMSILKSENYPETLSKKYFQFSVNEDCNQGSITAVLIKFSEYLNYIPGNAMPFYVISTVFMIVAGAFLFTFVCGLFEICFMRNQFKKNEFGTPQSEI